MSETAQEVELALDHRCRLAVVLGICLVAFFSSLRLDAAELEYAPQLKPAPLKGLESSHQSTISWNVIPLSTVMKGPNEFDWSYLENKLNYSSAAGKMMILRPVMDYFSPHHRLPLYLTNIPGATYTVPREYAFLNYPQGATVPVYTNEFVRAAITNFIRAFGEKYDGDPRIGFVEAGLIGTWGEWYSLNLIKYPHTTVPLEMKEEILQTYQDSFKRTKVLMRWPDKDLAGRPFGYHDDWFAHWTSPDSLFRMQTKAGTNALSRWQTHPIGARLHPDFDTDYKSNSLDLSLVTEEKLLALIRRDHISWVRYPRPNPRYIPSVVLANLEKLAPKMGYELYVSTADWTLNKLGKNLQLSATITNTAVAPFYYTWQMEVGLWHNGELQQTWPVDWDITRILPGEDAIIYTATLNEFPRRLKNARLLLHVVNPMKSGFPLRFANQTQDADLDGWLTLGSVENK